MGFNAYNKFIGYENLSYRVIEYLINNNENVWKMLKYNSPDALSQPNLTIVEKAGLIYQGETDSEPFRVFRDSFTDDATTEQITQLRIFPAGTNPENRIVAIQDIQLQIIVHTKINHMEDYQMRLDRMIAELLKTLNGADIGTVGQLYFDRDRSRSNGIMRGASVGNNKNFLGGLITMSVNLASPDSGCGY